jgi:hypothetical protein
MNTADSSTGVTHQVSVFVGSANGEMFTTQRVPLQRGLPRMKGKNFSHSLDAIRRLTTLLLAQFATNSGKGFSQIGFYTFRVAERRIEDGLHLTSMLVL